MVPFVRLGVQQYKTLLNPSLTLKNTKGQRRVFTHLKYNLLLLINKIEIIYSYIDYNIIYNIIINIGVITK
jgi:hypothetical protein